MSGMILTAAAISALVVSVAGVAWVVDACNPAVRAQIRYEMTEYESNEASGGRPSQQTFFTFQGTGSEALTLDSTTYQFGPINPQAPPYEYGLPPTGTLQDARDGRVPGLAFDDQEPLDVLSPGDVLAMDGMRGARIDITDAEGEYVGGSAPFQGCPLSGPDQPGPGSPR